MIDGLLDTGTGCWLLDARRCMLYAENALSELTGNKGERIVYGTLGKAV